MLSAKHSSPIIRLQSGFDRQIVNDNLTMSIHSSEIQNFHDR